MRGDIAGKEKEVTPVCCAPAEENLEVTPTYRERAGIEEEFNNALRELAQ